MTLSEANASRGTTASSSVESRRLASHLEAQDPNKLAECYARTAAMQRLAVHSQDFEWTAAVEQYLQTPFDDCNGGRCVVEASERGRSATQLTSAARMVSGSSPSTRQSSSSSTNMRYAAVTGAMAAAAGRAAARAVTQARAGKWKEAADMAPANGMPSQRLLLAQALRDWSPPRECRRRIWQPPGRQPPGRRRRDSSGWRKGRPVPNRPRRVEAALPHGICMERGMLPSLRWNHPRGVIRWASWPCAGFNTKFAD